MMAYSPERNGLVCPYCGKETELIKGPPVASKQDSDWHYACKPCAAWVLCHKSTTIAYGYVAKVDIRDKRFQLHTLLKKIENKVGCNKSVIYDYMAYMYGEHNFHTAWLHPEELDYCIELLKSFKPKSYFWWLNATKRNPDLVESYRNSNKQARIEKTNAN